MAANLDVTRSCDEAARATVHGKCDWDKRSGQIGRKSAINVQMCQPRHTLRYQIRILIGYICNAFFNAIIHGYQFAYLDFLFSNCNVYILKFV